MTNRTLIQARTVKELHDIAKEEIERAKRELRDLEKEREAHWWKFMEASWYYNKVRREIDEMISQYLEAERRKASEPWFPPKAGAA